MHDEEFDTLITDPQPRGAFARWWDVQNTYAYLIALQLSPKDRRDDGDRVELGGGPDGSRQPPGRLMVVILGVRYSSARRGVDSHIVDFIM
ncbi:hypothetical protein AB0B31_23175 [Catellatospora citrea]|uniref:hypothetical protein n=1 Tax=Catellatospora citrea TaxID=53366 RepID=UPI0033E4DC83